MICGTMAKITDNKSIQISAEAMDAVERMLGVYGVRITKKDLIERIILWMDEQSDVVKGSIMGTIPASHRADVARLELERLANSAPENDQSGSAGVTNRARIRAGAKLREVKETLPKPQQPTHSQ